MKNGLDFRGGAIGALAPFALFLWGVGWLALTGAPDERGFWPVLLAALTLGLLLARDRTRFCEVVLEGMSQPIVMVMIMAWLLSGVLGAVLAASGFVEALVWLTREAGLRGAGYVLAAFLACAVISTATGTSFGTMLLAGPLLYPAGAGVGADPAILIGAILGGATFGDSVSPVSDTTIASAGTQGADIGGVVRSRAKYALPAGLMAMAGLAALSLTHHVAAPSGAAVLPEVSSRGLPMLLIPVLVIGLLLARRHLLEGLLLGILAAIALALATGRMPADRLLYIDRAAFGAKGVILDGMNRGIGASIFTILLVGMVAALQATGILERVVQWSTREGTSARRTEAWIVSAVSAAVLLTTHSIVAILAVGQMAKSSGERIGLSAYRRANLLDLTVCIWPFLLPYCIPTILAASASASGEAFGMPRVSPFQAGVHNTYSWALILVVVVAIATGYGRGEAPSSDARR
ncbi:MAG: Na+/H+ antiporter NhaC family protein [Gemmatimonadaceae bacterium]